MKSPESGERSRVILPLSVEKQWKAYEADREQLTSSIEQRMGSRAVDDAWADIGGGYRPHQSWFEDGLRLAANNEHYLDLRVAFEQFNLADLTMSDVNGLTNPVRKELALQLQNYVAQIASRVKTLAVQGNHEHPAFMHYGFENDEQARDYAETLARFHNSLVAQPQFNSLLNEKFDQGQRNRAAQRRGQFQLAKDYRGKIIYTNPADTKLKAA